MQAARQKPSTGWLLSLLLGKYAPAFGFQTGVLYYHANWIGNLAIGIAAVSYLSTFFPAINNPIPALLPVYYRLAVHFALLICWAGRVGAADNGGLFGADPGSLDRGRRLA